MVVRMNLDLHYYWTVVKKTRALHGCRSNSARRRHFGFALGNALRMGT